MDELNEVMNDDNINTFNIHVDILKTKYGLYEICFNKINE